jgi:hypothetical protein
MSRSYDTLKEVANPLEMENLRKKLKSMSRRRMAEWMYRSTSFLTSELVGGEWSASHTGRFTPPQERAPGPHCLGGRVGLRPGLDEMLK